DAARVAFSPSAPRPTSQTLRHLLTAIASGSRATSRQGGCFSCPEARSGSPHRGRLRLFSGPLPSNLVTCFPGTSLGGVNSPPPRGTRPPSPASNPPEAPLGATLGKLFRPCGKAWVRGRNITLALKRSL